MGRELNPRCSSFDVKQVVFRSGMIAWMMVDWMYLAAQFKADQKVQPALALVVLFHTLYVVMTVKNEQFWFSTADFRNEGIGFLSVWACLSLFPFIFSLQARFLYLYPKEGMTNPYTLAAVFILNAVGLVFYIGSNWQKNEFRKNPYNPDLSHLSSIPTAAGKRIICSGWWGIVRRPNYLGDLIMAVAWSLPCGCSYALPYFYPVYLISLLVTKVIADEKSCHQRYGDAWVKYTEAVPYKLIPYVF
ncbi:LBR [Bugula neritina]|uniref:LBR n=1 Tax=Bugula neritina TaxID=10212 RepID=A0A7J7JC36_BUGNE|nr:LBR [Bugula neritina]